MTIKMVKAALAVGVALATAVALPAWERKVKMEDLPEAVRQTVLEVSRGAKLREITREEKDRETIYEAELEVDGRIRDVSISPRGVVVLVEEEVPWSEVPAAVRTTIEKEAQGQKILLVETLTRNGTLESYEAHVRKWLWTEFEVLVDPEGRLIEVK